MSINSLITFKAGQKIKASETNQNNNYLLNEIINRINSFRTEINNLMEDFKLNVSSGVLKTGDIKLAAYSVVPDTFLICNGANLLISEYPELYAKIGTLFGQTDSLHFSLPDFRDKVPEGFKDASEPFGSIQSGKAPNITASLGLGLSGAYFIEATGAFYQLAGSSTRNEYQKEAGARVAYFSASACSPVYQNVPRITVDRLKVNFLIKYKD